MTVSSVGATSRDYSTWASWEAACPANLVTAADTWEGEGYNDSEFVVAAGVLVVNGITADATHNVQIRCATGESFKDHADAATNPLTYDASKGVGLRATDSSVVAVRINVPYTSLNGLQIKVDGGGSFPSSLVVQTTGGGCSIKDSILHNSSASLYYTYLDLSSTAADESVNLLIQVDGDNGLGVFSANVAHKFINCGMVCTHASLGNIGWNAVSASPIAENCYSFGFANDWSGTWGTSTNNASDGTGSPGSNPVDSLTFANQFVDTAGDFRLKAGSGLEAAGVQSGETSDLDIIGQARNTSTPDIGCWEYQTPAGGGLLPMMNHHGLHTGVSV